VETNILLTGDHAELDRLLEKICREIHADDETRLFELLDYFWARLAMHIRAEHLHLFPAILRAIEQEDDAAEIRTAIECLRADHNVFMKELARLMKTRQDAAATIEAVASRLKTHNAIEESLIYSLTARLLPLQDQSELALKVKGELDNLPRRFKTIDHGKDV
jgi:iron-sulfur cluster repair protein YtfE (RIC family)